MRDDKKLLQELKNMPEYHMDIETKSRILKNLEEQNRVLEKKHKPARIIRRVTAGMAACAAAAVILLAVFTPTGQDFINRLWNAQTPGQNQAQNDNKNPAQDDNKNVLQNTPGLEFTSVRMVDESNGWGAAQSKIVRTTDGGRTWEDKTPEDLKGMIKYFPIDANQCYAASAESMASPLYIYFTSDGGKSWLKAQSPENGSIAGAQFLDANNGWILLGQDAAMHHEEVAILHTTGGNTAWSTITKTDSQGNEEQGKIPFVGLKSGIYFADSKNGWITGYEPAPGYAYLYNTKDGGLTWNEKTLPVPGNMKQADLSTEKPQFFSAKDGIIPVKVSNDIMQYFFFITHDGGETWAPGNPANVSPDQPFIFDFISKDNGFGTDGISIYKTSDGGLTWKASAVNIKLNRTTVLDFISLKEGFAVVDGTLFKTVDGGNTWSQLTSGPLRAPGIEESRIGAPLPYAPETDLKPSQSTEDGAKELINMYLEHYSNKNIPESDRIKSFTVNSVKILRDTGSNIVFSVDYTLQGVIDTNSWASGNYAYAGNGMVKNGMLYITSLKENNKLKITSISNDLPFMLNF